MAAKALASTIAGKKALVFGGTSGIGLATSLQLQAMGAQVVAISRDPSKAGEVGAVKLAKADVLDRDGLGALFASEAPFDILVNAATGGKRAIGPFIEMGLDGYRGSFDKLWGYTNVVQLGTPHLTPNGCIVLVSGAPARKPNPGQVALASVGAAVEQMARSIAREIAPRRINVVCPGTIDTPMFGPGSEEQTARLAAMTANNPIKRAGKPEECAKGIIFAIGTSNPRVRVSLPCFVFKPIPTRPLSRRERVLHGHDHRR